MWRIKRGDTWQTHSAGDTQVYSSGRVCWRRRPLSVGPTEQTLSRTARAHVPKPVRHDTCRD